MDPAVKEALTSRSSIFQDPKFDELKEYQSLHGSFTQEIQEVSNTLEANYQNIEQQLNYIESEQND